MIRKCPACGKEYELTPFSFDKGACPNCPRPLPFHDVFRDGNWWKPTPEGTRAVWKSVVFFHIAGTAVCVFFLGLMLCDTGFLSVPLVAYSGSVLAYFAARFAIAAFKGYPILTKIQKSALLLLPFYGFPAVATLFYLAQCLRNR